MSKANKVLVTGATGFLGANLTKKLVGGGYDVHILIRSTSNKWRLLDIKHKIKEHMADLTNFGELRKVVRQIKPDIIFHLAATGIHGGKHLPDRDLINVNFIGTFNLVNACNDIDYRCFVNTGSSSEYGPKKDRMRCDDICEPVNTYGIAKLAATLYTKKVAKEKNKPIMTLRLFSPYGAYDDPSRLVTHVITKSLRNEDLHLANPEAVRDYIYVEDVIDLYLKTIDNAKKYCGEIFNAGTGKQTKISDIVEIVTELTKSKSKIFWNSVKPRSYDTEKWEAEIEKTCKAFNWMPRFSIKQGLMETVSWFRDNIDLY